MSDKPNSKTPDRPVDARAERLAAALRANLRRRKDQTRGRKAEDTDAPADVPPDEDGEI